MRNVSIPEIRLMAAFIEKKAEAIENSHRPEEEKTFDEKYDFGKMPTSSTGRFAGWAMAE